MRQLQNQRDSEPFLNSTRTVTKTLPALLGSPVKWIGTLCIVTTTPALCVRGALGEGQVGS